MRMMGAGESGNVQEVEYDMNAESWYVVRSSWRLFGRNFGL